jgi:hypothetical protein
MNNRANNLVTLRDIERASVDYYATIRTCISNGRARLIEDRPVRTANYRTLVGLRTAKNALNRP